MARRAWRMAKVSLFYLFHAPSSLSYAAFSNGQLTTDNGHSDGVGGHENLGPRIRMYVAG